MNIAEWKIEAVRTGILILAIFIHLAAYSKLCDRVTRLEAIVKLLENEIKLIHEKGGEKNGRNHGAGECMSYEEAETETKEDSR